MCGIVGFIEAKLQTEERLRETVDAMSRVLAHRGPDDSRVWVDAQAGVALGFRRLAILDLSPAGSQPMSSHCGRYVMVFNGEVYNFRELRAELEGHGVRFHSRSDSEVILASISHWGIERALPKFVGMFAFAIWDRLELQLHLVRDRLGIKPLYYGWAGESFIFASELKAFRAYAGFSGDVDRQAVALFMRFNYIPQPWSIFTEARKLPPGTVFSASLNDLRRRHGRIHAFWSAQATYERAKSQGFRGSEPEALDQLEALLKEVISLRMVSDVPLGAFLSGGIDSTLVVAMMQAQLRRPVQTYTIGFDEATYNEAPYAEKVARHLGTDHTELYVTPSVAQGVVPRLPELYDEPFADASQIPTFLVSQLARQNVTVTLSGDGGDELFGGYNRYLQGQALWGYLGKLPHFGRNLVSSGLRLLSKESWDNLHRKFSPFLPPYFHVAMPGEKAHKLAEYLQVAHELDFYRGLVSQWTRPTDIVLGTSEPPTVFEEVRAWLAKYQLEDQMMFSDVITYLVDDILVKVDRASMSVGLEARVPLLDHRLVEFAWRLPLRFKIRRGTTKWILRRLLSKFIPDDLTNRPKMGFGIPVGEWLRTDLRDWAEDLLEPKRMREDGFLSVTEVRRVWDEHISGKREWGYRLWTVLMFQAWLVKVSRSAVASAVSGSIR